MSKKRKTSGDDWDDEHELAMATPTVGSVNSITETPKKRRGKMKPRRPIGYLCDLDEALKDEE